MKKRIIISLLMITFCMFLTGCSKVLKLNEQADIKADSIKLTVLESEKATINQGELALANGDYIKVKVTIENYGNETYTWNTLNFSLGGEIPSLKTLTQPDILQDEIAPGQTATGYIYFNDNNSSKLTYTSKTKNDGKKVKVEKVEFKIK